MDTEPRADAIENALAVRDVLGCARLHLEQGGHPAGQRVPAVEIEATAIQQGQGQDLTARAWVR